MLRRLLALLTALASGSAGAQAQAPSRSGPPALRGIAVDERLAARAVLGVGDTIQIGAVAGAPGERVVVVAITRRSADPSEIARSEYRVRLHLDHLQTLTGVGDRVGRFAVATRGGPGAADTVAAAARINALAFGFRAYRASDVAVETSATFRVVNRFHRAIGVITIVASAIFLLCITLLKVDERRRDVGALRLIGISRGTVLRAIVLEASCIALLGSAMGAGLGSVAGWIVNWHYQGLYSTPLKFAIVTPEIVLFATLLSLVLGVVAGIVAAQRLVREAPLSLVGR